MAKRAFVFPGQGAQYIGMGREICENFAVSKRVFEEAGDALGFDLYKRVAEGSEEDLMLTEVTQPAILTTSIAVLAAVKEAGLDSDFAAGLSLGEYTALVHAGALSFADAVVLSRERGRIMQEAVPEGVGAMAPIVGIGYDQAVEFIKEIDRLGVVEISNYNAPAQVVISGNAEAVKAAVDLIKSRCHVKVVFLPVSAPFHTSLLREASERFAEVIRNVEVLPLRKSVVTNVTGSLVNDISEIKPNLVKQFYSTVLWAPSVQLMLDSGVTEFVEMGPGHSLSGMISKCAKAAGVSVKINNVEDMETFNMLIS